MEKFDYPIPYMKSVIEDIDKQYVNKVLASNIITQGEYVKKVEDEFSVLTNKKFSVMCSNGTAALHLVAEMVNAKYKKESKNIITTPLTFVADANFGRYINADIKFADIDENSWTISPESVETLIDKDTIAVVAPHYAGLMCDIKKIQQICLDNGIFLVEDACHAPLAKYKGVVSGSIGDASTFSFHATKHISSGEGGVISVNSEDDYELLGRLRSHGLPHWSKRTGYGYDIDEVAFNYRPNEMSAALALSHIRRLDSLIEYRLKIAKIYDDNLNFEFYTKQLIPNDATHVYHLYPLLLPTTNLREKFLDYLKTKNIFGQIHYPPINKMTGFRTYSSKTPISDDVTSRIVSIPMYPTLSDSEQEFVIEKINEFSNIID